MSKKLPKRKLKKIPKQDWIDPFVRSLVGWRANREARLLVKLLTNFPVVVTKGGKWFIARCPTMDLVTQGKTEKEAMENMTDLIDEYLSDPDIPKPGIGKKWIPISELTPGEVKLLPRLKKINMVELARNQVRLTKLGATIAAGAKKLYPEFWPRAPRARKLTLGQAKREILDYLREHGPTHVSEIAIERGIDLDLAFKAAKRLEEEGKVK